MKPKPNDELLYDWRRSLEHRRGLSKSTIAAKLAALRAFEDASEGRSFMKLRREDVIAFKEQLLAIPSSATGERRSCSTFVHTLDHCRDFFSQLAEQKEGRELDREAIAWFTATRADKERARAVPPKTVPSLAEAKAVFAAMPTVTLHNRRDRAVFSTLLLAAIRADALASLTLGSIDLAMGSIWQDSRIIRTKSSKSFTVYFLPFVSDARDVLKGWIDELLDFGLAQTDALFPRDIELARLEAREQIGPGEYPVWRGSTQVRAIIQNAFKAAGLPVHNPHVFRHMLTRHFFELGPSAEEIMAFSINLGHKRLETTLDPYARPDDDRRRRLIARLGEKSTEPQTIDLDAIVKRLAETNSAKAAEIILELVKRDS